MISICSLAHAQNNTITFSIDWSDSLQSLELSDYKLHKLPYFDGVVYDEKKGYLPHKIVYINLPFYASVTARYTILETVPLNDNETEALSGCLGFLSDSNLTNANSIISGNEFRAILSIPAIGYGERSGMVGKVLKARIEYTIQPVAQKVSRDYPYAENSVLSTGTWYKIPVNQDGIYKIDKNYLNNLGINTNSINPKNIRIYGNGGGMLPEANNQFRYDDLQENAIHVFGESDGVFNDNDYVIFYGQSPNRWFADTINNTYFHRTNIYSDLTYYFLTTSLGPGKRMANQPNSDVAPTHTITTFDDYQFTEPELFNLIQSGREWYGNEFRFEQQQSFPFSFSNVNTAVPVSVKVDVASRSLDGPRTFNVTANGQTLGNINISNTGANYTDTYAFSKNASFNYNTSQSSINIGLNYSNTANDANGWLNYIEVVLKRNLLLTGNQMHFRSMETVGPGHIASYTIGNFNSLYWVLDITNPVEVMRQDIEVTGTNANFKIASDTLKQFCCFNPASGLLTPLAGSSIGNQNLHGTGITDYVIVAPNEFIPAAEALAAFHKQQFQYNVKVVTPASLYNEFSSGAQDITAIKDFMRMLRKKAIAQGYAPPKYLLLFGDASYDYKNKVVDNTNVVPTFESLNSLSPVLTFCSDDYFGFLDDSEGANVLSSTDALDIAIGRLPASTIDEAWAVATKIRNYVTNSKRGSWQNIITLVADDGDINEHFKDAEKLYNYINTNYPVWNIDKIYIDAYQQISASSGQRAPEVNNSIKNRMYNGTLIFNYLGHGGINGLAHERILQVSDFDTWNNCCQLPLFVTATCEFSRFDDPGAKSAGEYLVLRPEGGAISLVTTLRLVYAYANYILNSNFTYKIFEPVNNYYYTIGEAFRIGKNNTVGTSFADVINTRKFALLGDPGIYLNYPDGNVVTTEINTQPYSGSDTIKALQKITIKGKVTDNSGNTINTFNGRVYPIIYDKPQKIQTLGDESAKMNFDLQRNIIYKGKATVTNGLFSAQFVVPKDINYQFGNGKISYFAEDNNTDAHGYNTIIVGGVSDSSDSDTDGPEIKLFMNDEKFVFGGLTDESPFVYLKLKDDNGINTTGNGIGHDITGTLDNQTKSSFVMNDFYEANQDDYTSGSVKYPLRDLSSGRHTLDVKCWDVFNNSNTAYTEFIVASSADAALSHVLNYPNPFTTETEFMFEHNLPGSNLDVKVEIFTISGKLIKTIRTNVIGNTNIEDVKNCNNEFSEIGGYRVDGIMWDGRDDFGDLIGKGVYVYRVSIRSDSGLKAEKFEKLVVLK